MSKRVLSCILILMLTLTFVPTAQAATSVSGAVKEYKSALSSQSKAKTSYTKAKKAYDEASVDFNKGSYGFFKWVSENKTGWEAEDAKEAMQIIDKTAFKKYMKIGDKNDATSLGNMKECIALFSTLNKDRKNDENIKGLPEATFRHVYMARAQVNANASSVTGNHMPGDSGCSLGAGAENLAWGYSDPFYGWYNEEKVVYNKIRAYFLKEYNRDININEDEDYLIDHLDNYYEKCAEFGETGHYSNVLSGITASYGNNGVTYGMAKRSIFGLGLNTNAWPTHCLEVDSFDSYDNSYTESEYKDLFDQYFNMVNPKVEKEAYDSALSKYKAAIKKSESKLNTVRTISKPTVKKAVRKGKKITVTWKKKSGVRECQISVASSKKGTKIKKTVKGTKATIKLKSAKPKYVKVRSVIKINGKKIYSKWSKVKRTR